MLKPFSGFIKGLLLNEFVYITSKFDKKDIPHLL
jgi:hypothetical protein